MYLPALAAHPDAEVVAVCGRSPESTDQFATQWGIKHAFTDPTLMMASVPMDAVIIATSNDGHHPLAISAMRRGMHVLCEKPLALDADQAAAMAELAGVNKLITMVPFTYRYMPMNQWVKRLVATGYVGRPLHINMRYYASFGFDDSYSWRFDRSVAGAGIIGDLGPHWIDLARWFLDDAEVSVSALATTFTDRAARPNGADYERLEDSAVMNVRYRSGAYGVLHTSAVCWEGSDFNQTHHLDLHGSDGTVYAYNDWSTVQEVRGVRANALGPAAVMPIPDEIWGHARRDRVHDTYRDVFRGGGAMIGDWVDAVRDGVTCSPDLHEGARVQFLLDLALQSAASDGRLLNARA